MQQQTNFFTPTPKHLIQLHGFPNITDIIYVKPLYSVRSLVVYPSLRPDSVAIPLFHSAEGQRYLSPQYYLLFEYNAKANIKRNITVIPKVTICSSDIFLTIVPLIPAIIGYTTIEKKLPNDFFAIFLHLSSRILLPA